MTPLTAAVLALLQAEVGMPALSAKSISRNLWVTGASPEGRPATVEEVESALAELMTTGAAERIWRRGPAHYRLIEALRPVVADDAIQA